MYDNGVGHACHDAEGLDRYIARNDATAAAPAIDWSISWGPPLKCDTLAMPHGADRGEPKEDGCASVYT